MVLSQRQKSSTSAAEQDPRDGFVGEMGQIRWRFLCLLISFGLVEIVVGLFGMYESSDIPLVKIFVNQSYPEFFSFFLCIALLGYTLLFSGLSLIVWAIWNQRRKESEGIWF